jgi:hypothetical protein
MDPFTVEAQARIGLLLEEFGFSHVGTGSNLLIYDSANLKVRVFQGLRSGTIGIEFVRAGHIINLGDLLAAAGVDNPGMTSRDLPLTKKRLQWLASFLRKHFIELISGDPEAFNNVQRIAAERDAVYTKRLNVDPEIALANEAFHRGHYGEVISLLAPLETSLSASESRKLAYARKHNKCQ